MLVEGVSRRGGNQRVGRDPYNRVVNFSMPADGSIEAVEPGQLLDVVLVDATPHSLIGEPISPENAARSSAPTAHQFPAGLPIPIRPIQNRPIPDRQG